MVRTYEAVFAISSKLNENETKEYADKLKKIIENSPDTKIIDTAIEARNFPYLIKKENKGTFVTFSFEAPPEAIKQIKEELKHRDEILRTTFIKKE